MITIVLIDDEYYFRKAIRKYIEETNGYQVIGEAKNGKEGFEIIKRMKPDIILVDINMPLMNGIEVAEAINKESINSRVIILTGYSMFEYAQQSIRLGVHDYLLKPIDKLQLIQTLSNTAKKIEMENNREERNQEFNTRKAEISTAIRDHFINKIIRAKKESEWMEITRLSKEFPEILGRTSYFVILIDIYLKESISWKEEDSNIYGFLVKNILSELYENNMVNCIVGSMDINKLCVLVSSDDGLEELNTKNNEVLSSFEKLVRQYQFAIPLLISVGSGKSNINDIPESYNEACAIGKSKYLYQEKGIYFYDKFSIKKIKGNSFLSEKSMQLMVLIRANMTSDIVCVLKEIFSEMIDQKLSPQIVHIQANEILSCAFEVAKKSKIFVKADEEQWHILPPEINDISIFEIEQKVTEYVLMITEVINPTTEKPSYEVTNEVLYYIEKNYMNSNLSLDNISKKIGISKTILCLYFKDVTNTTIGEHLLRMRMINAKQRFDEGYTNISFVAESCGYSDAGYFSKRFKKYFGIAPSDYVKKI
ncbi:MAG: response regulator [Suipraeoptans sp.]